MTPEDVERTANNVVEPLRRAIEPLEKMARPAHGAEMRPRLVDTLTDPEMMRNFAEMGARKNREIDANIVAGELAKANMASEFHARLLRLIEDFDKHELDNEHEVGVRLVSFGQSVVFRVEELGFHNPSLIIFHGRTEDGNNPVTLIQHVSQISFLLTSLRRANPETPKMPFGFTSQRVRDFHDLATSQGMSWSDEFGCWIDKDGKRFDREGTPINAE